jgi:8-oxo-dGTP diphosphatase
MYLDSMNASRHREISGAIVIDTGGRLLLQARDDVAGIMHPGKVGLFGGHREGDETHLECMVRELHEEISYFVSPEHFEHLASIDGVDIDGDGGTLRAEFFLTRGIPVEPLVVTEGSLLIVEPDGIGDIESRLTPSARFAIHAFLEKRS